MGFDLIIYDKDEASEENIGSQRYGFPDIGIAKTDVLKKRLEENYQISVGAYNEFFEGQHDLSGITVCGVDSLETRAKIWESVKFNPMIPIYLDSRVGGERFKLFALNPCDPKNIARYETHLDLSRPRTEMPCTSRFAPQAGIALDWITSCIIKEWIVGNPIPFQITGQNLEIRKTF
jgi:hypothetical protein